MKIKSDKYIVSTQKSFSEKNEVQSYRLLVQGGFINKNALGLYSYNPLALEVIKKIKSIIRNELEKVGCLEIAMPFIQSCDLWN